MKRFFSRKLRIHSCSNCGKEIDDLHFTTCGLMFENPQAPDEGLLYFDYACPHCDFIGRWTWELLTGTSAIEALEALVEALKAGESDHMQKGDIIEKLNKINNIQDLLDMGGDDAPRERSNRDGDLP